MLILCKCKNIVTLGGEVKGSGPGSDFVTFARHLGGSRGMPPPPRNFFFNSKDSEMDSGAI